MVTSTKPATKKGVGSGNGFPGPNGKKPGGNGWRGDGSRRGFSPGKYKVTMWVALASIVMMFVALSSAYIVLAGNQDRQPVKMPPMFFVSTAVIVASSWTYHRASRSLSAKVFKGHARWLLITLLLGVAFLGSQLTGWRELAQAGVYFAGQPHSSFFYLFTGLHGAHLTGGIVLLMVLVVRTRRQPVPIDFEKERTWTGVVGLYWHTMDVIWIWLFLLLLVFK
jgi:cytochrome c oxidase subunit III